MPSARVSYCVYMCYKCNNTLFYLLFFYSLMLFREKNNENIYLKFFIFTYIFTIFGGGGGLVTKWCPTLGDPMDWEPTRLLCLSLGFSRQEYWSGLPFLSLGDLHDPGIEPRSPVLQADSLPTELQEQFFLQLFISFCRLKSPSGIISLQSEGLTLVFIVKKVSLATNNIYLSVNVISPSFSKGSFAGKNSLLTGVSFLQHFMSSNSISPSIVPN